MFAATRMDVAKVAARETLVLYAAKLWARPLGVSERPFSYWVQRAMCVFTLR